MLTFIATIHVIVCLLLITIVLVQDPKSSGAGGVFGGGGGGSNSLLGATGAVTFLTRFTRYLACIFGVTCLILTLLSRPNAGSVLDTAPAANLPAAPAAEQPAGQSVEQPTDTTAPIESAPPAAQ